MKRKGLIIGPLPKSITEKAAPGGIATHIDELLRYLKVNDIDIYICYHKPYDVKKDNVLVSNKIRWLFNVVHGFMLLIFNKNYNLFKYTIKDNIVVAFYFSKLKIFFQKNDPDFVHIHSLHNPAPYALNLLRYKQKIIITDHGFWQGKYLDKKKIISKLVKNYSIADSIIYISDMAYQKHLNMNFWDTHKLVKINNPTDFSAFPIKEKNEKNTDKVIFFNGYSESISRKGFDILVSTINMYPDLYNNIKLIAICDEYSENHIKTKSWNFKCELIGKTTLKNILNILCNSDLFVVPSRSEGFSLAYIEALAVGIPVIGYFGQIDEMKKTLNTYIGESFNPDDEGEEGLMKKIVLCLNTPFDVHLVRENLIKNYSWDVLGKKILELYYPSKRNFVE